MGLTLRVFDDPEDLQGGPGGALGGHLEIGGRRPSRSDPAQVRVLRLGHTTRERTCVGGLGFEKLLQDVSMHFPGLPVDPGSLTFSCIQRRPQFPLFPFLRSAT